VGKRRTEVGGRALGRGRYPYPGETFRRRSGLRICRRSVNLEWLPIGIGRSGAVGIG